MEKKLPDFQFTLKFFKKRFNLEPWNLFWGIKYQNSRPSLVILIEDLEYFIDVNQDCFYSFDECELSNDVFKFYTAEMSEGEDCFAFKPVSKFDTNAYFVNDEEKPDENFSRLNIEKKHIEKMYALKFLSSKTETYI